MKKANYISMSYQNRLSLVFNRRKKMHVINQLPKWFYLVSTLKLRGASPKKKKERKENPQ